MTSRLSVLLAALLLAVLPACSTLPVADWSATPSKARPPASGSSMARHIAAATGARPGQSGFHVLASNESALATRLSLVRQATSSIDLQYYLFHRDTCGLALLSALFDAADRGVRVRILVDDLDVVGIDRQLKALEAHPNIEVRLFNPFMQREAGALGRSAEFLVDSVRLNRRMHNKLFAVDNRIAIVGGRNVGDEYLLSRPEAHFKDLDALIIGPVVAQSSACFDAYWNSRWAVPVEAFKGGRDRVATLSALRKTLRAAGKSAAVAAALREADAATWPRDLREGRVAWTWGRGRVIWDPPEKMDPTQAIDLLGKQIQALGRGCGKELIIVSSYFVPGAVGTKRLTDLARSGVRVRVLTNSLASTDVPAVHGGYRRYRRELLEAGVELYELKPEAAPRTRGDWKAPSSRASLHAKTFVFDEQAVFIGSFNADPRSVNLNTEMGLLADSPELARQVRALFEQAIQPQASYRVTLGSIGLEWHCTQKGKPKVYRSEPRASWWRKFTAGFVGALPVESQL